MPSQLPLLNPDGQELASPLFRAQPGWGGKLNQWFKHNGPVVVFRVVILLAIVAIIVSVLRSRGHNRTTPSPTPTPLTGTQPMYRETAVPSEGVSHLVARAVDAVLHENTVLGTLKPVEHLWAVDRLTRVTLLTRQQAPFVLHPGDTLDFDGDIVSSVIVQAKQISPTARAALEPYLRH